MPGILDALTGCDGFICCIGCLSLCPTVITRFVNSVSFFPPTPQGYSITENGEVFLFDNADGLAPLSQADGLSIDTIRMYTERGNTIVGFHMKHTTGNPRTLLFSHGNSTDIGIMFGHLRDLALNLGVNIFAYEYSGYGESTGKPTEANLYADVDAAYRFLIDDCGIPPDQIVMYGQSIGSVPSLDLAARNHVGGVILHSPMKSGLAVIHEVKYTYWFDVFQNATKIRQVRAPVFIIHGTHDTEIPFEHGSALWQGLPAEFAYRPWWVKEAGHNDIELNHRSLYFEEISNFLKALDHPTKYWRKGDGMDMTDDADRDSEQPLLSGSSSPAE